MADIVVEEPTGRVADGDSTPPDRAVEQQRSATALALLGVALLMGLLGQTLLKMIPWGVNVPLWIGTLLIVALLLAQRLGGASGSGRWLAIPAFLFAAAVAVRDSDTLLFFSVLAVLGSLMLGMLYARRDDLGLRGLVGYATSLLLALVLGVIEPLRLLLDDIKWRHLPQTPRSGALVALLRGVLVAIPLLLCFGILLTAADQLFADTLSDLLNLNLDRLVGDLAGSAFWAWLVAAFLGTLLLGKASPVEAGNPPTLIQLGRIELGVILGSLNLLFLGFLAVQSRYFFGGNALVSSDPVLSYADYARRGFFELVAVAALAMAVLLVLHWMTRPEDGRSGTLFRWLAVATILLVFVMMASAMHRMWLYTLEFGLTELRVYVTAFMGWIAFLLIWFSTTVLRGQRQRFAIGALASAFVALAALILVNPDGLIARVNLSRGTVAPLSGDAREVDALYLMRLSAAAVPPLVAQIDNLPRATSCIVATRLLDRWQARDSDWRSWNWDRWRATRAVEAARPHLEAIGCDPDYSRDGWMD